MKQNYKKVYQIIFVFVDKYIIKNSTWDISKYLD